MIVLDCETCAHESTPGILVFLTWLWKKRCTVSRLKLARRPSRSLMDSFSNLHTLFVSVVGARVGHDLELLALVVHPSHSPPYTLPTPSGRSPIPSYPLLMTMRITRNAKQQLEKTGVTVEHTPALQGEPRKRKPKSKATPSVEAVSTYYLCLRNVCGDRLAVSWAYSWGSVLPWCLDHASGCQLGA